jgi:hypothetical protein
MFDGTRAATKVRAVPDRYVMENRTGFRFSVSDCGKENC